MTAYTIRMAEPADAAPLAALGRQTFTENFGYLYTRENLQYFLEGVYAPELQRLEIGDPQNLMLIAESNGELVGYAKAGLCKLPLDPIPHGAYELHRIYVTKAAAGQGLGAQLLQQVFDWFLAREARSVYVGVWSGNEGAQRFYARHGFAKVGEYHFMVGEHADDEWIMRLQNWPHTMS